MTGKASPFKHTLESNSSGARDQSSHNLAYRIPRDHIFACLWEEDVIVSLVVAPICYHGERQSHLRLRLGLTRGRAVSITVLLTAFSCRNVNTRGIWGSRKQKGSMLDTLRGAGHLHGHFPA